MSHGKLLSTYYLFETPIQAACKAVGLVRPGGRGGTGRGTVSAHRFRHTVGTQLAERGAKLHTIMKVLGHTSVNMALVYAQISDQEVLRDYKAVLGPGATIAGPAAEELRSGTLPDTSIDWLKTNFFKTELELGRCLRLPAEGPCECDLYLTCAKFVTTPEYAPRLRARREVEETLAHDATERGWDREVERHRCTSERIERLLADLSQPITRKRRRTAPVRDHPMAELPERSLLVNVDSGLRQEHVSIHRAIGDVEGVQPVRPVPHTRRAAETVVELPADPLTGGKTHGWGPSRPRWDGEQGLHSGKDAQPSVGFAKLDVNLAQVFLDAMGLEAVSLMHADHMGKRGRHRRDSEADRGRVPTGGGLSSAGLLRPGRPYPLNGDFHGPHPCHSIEDLTLCARLLRPAPTPPTARAATRWRFNLNCPHKLRHCVWSPDPGGIRVRAPARRPAGPEDVAH